MPPLKEIKNLKIWMYGNVNVYVLRGSRGAVCIL